MIDVVSVVVPYFNIEADRLCRCIESILSQKECKYEIVLVDDGSAGQNAALCDELAEVHSEIRVFHQENKGVSSARNAGIRESRGEYIMFVDPDDELYSDMCISESLDIAMSENADIVVGGVSYCFENKEFPSSYSLPNSKKKWVVESKRELKDFSEYYCCFALPIGSRIPSTLNRGPVAKLFRKSLFCVEMYDENLIYGEDAILNAEVFSSSKKVVIVDRVWYRYYQYAQSISHAKTFDEVKRNIDAGCNHGIFSGNPSWSTAFRVHCIIDTCVTMVQSRGFRARREMLQMLSEDWAKEALRDFSFKKYKVPKYKEVLIKLARVNSVFLICATMVIAGAFLRLQGKKVIC